LFHRRVLCMKCFCCTVSVANFSPKLRYSKEYVPAVGDLTVIVSREELSKVAFKVRPVQTDARASYSSTMALDVCIVSFSTTVLSRIGAARSLPCS
jgi:hypothetical protein